MFLIYECYHAGFGVEANKEESYAWGLKAANAAFAAAKPDVPFNIAVGAEQDRWNAFRWFQMNTDDNSLALVKLGMCLEHGWGFKTDVSKAFELFHISAAEGQPTAYISLGDCYTNGTGVKVDLAKAVQYYSRAPEDIWAQFKLGYILSKGSGFKLADPRVAFSWTLKAADAGLALAQYTVGLRYESGDGIETDLVKAAEWHQKALEGGIVGCYYRLGEIYKNNQAGQQDLTKAAEFFKKVRTAFLKRCADATPCPIFHLKQLIKF